MSKKKWWEYTTIVAQQIPPFEIPKDFARSEVAFCKKIGAETLFMFVELDGEYIFPSKYGPQYRQLKKRDLLRELVTECKEEGIRFVAAFMGMHCQTHLARKHPDWVFKTFREASDPNWKALSSTILCLNSPYRRILQGMAREVIEDYQVDGIYFDGVYYPAVYCFCKYCMKKYEEMFGKRMPLKLRDENRLKLGEETVVGWSKEIRGIINATNPETCYALDCHATIIGTSDSREQIDKTSEYVDVRIQECYPEIINEQPYYAEMENRAIAAETGKTVWWAKWIARNPDFNVISNPPAAIRLWGAATLAEKSPVLFVCQRVQDFDRRCVEPMKEMASIWRKARPHLRDAETIAPVALFHSIESKIERLPLKVREHRKYFEGWYLALRAQHIPFEVVSERNLLGEKMKKYSALILPNVRFMSDETVRGVRKFVEEGGALIASGYSSFSDEKGRNRKDFALGDILGAEYIGDTDGVHYGNRILTQYYRAFQRHPIAGRLQGNFYSFRGGMKFPLVRLARGTKSIFKTAAYDPELLSTGKYFVSYPTEKAADVVLAVREKPCRVVYMPAPLDGAYWEYGWPELAEIMANAVRWAIKGKIPLETDAEENLWLTLHRNEKKKTWILHLQNQGINNQYAIGYDCSLFWGKPEPLRRGHPVRVCFRTSPFSICLSAVKSSGLKAKSLTGKTLKLGKGKKGWLLRHPGISEHDLIILEEKGL